MKMIWCGGLVGWTAAGLALVSATAGVSAGGPQGVLPGQRGLTHIRMSGAPRSPSKPPRIHGVPGAVAANGTGAVEFSGAGQFTVTVAEVSTARTTDNGVLVYPRSAQVEVIGNAEPDMRHTTAAEAAFIHFSGRIRIAMMSGKVRVAAAAPITFTGEGIGKCSLRGSGNWTINGASGTWPAKAEKITVGRP